MSNPANPTANNPIPAHIPADRGLVDTVLRVAISTAVGGCVAVAVGEGGMGVLVAVLVGVLVGGTVVLVGVLVAGPAVFVGVGVPPEGSVRRYISPPWVAT